MMILFKILDIVLKKNKFENFEFELLRLNCQMIGFVSEIRGRKPGRNIYFRWSSTDELLPIRKLENGSGLIIR